jgi:alpha-1,6-mannosyltransferase
VKIGLIGVTALAVGGLSAGALPTGRPFYLSPAVRHGYGLPAAGMVCAVAGLVVLVVAWLRLRPAVTGQPRRALVVLACWTAPLVLAPPLFSRDIYSYLAQGALVGRGLDAYAVGPVALGGNPLVAQVHPLWLGTPAPYGPVFLGLAAAVVGVTGTHLVAGVLGMRAVALASLVALAWVVPRLAVRYRVDPGRALWLGVLNPLVLVHGVAGGHNDLLMVALLMTGLLLATQHRFAAAVVLVTLAALVKAPAAVGLCFIAPMWPGRWLGPGRWRWPAGIVATAAVAGTTVAVVTAVSGLGLGWVHTLSTPAIVHNGLSLSTDLGQLSGAVPAARLAGGLLAGCLCVAVWLRRNRLGTPAAIGFALGAVVLLGPVVHPWYLLWAVVPLAAGAKHVRWPVGLSVALSLVLLPHGVAFTARGVVEALVGVGIGSAVLALGQVLQRQPVPVDAQPADDSGGDGGDDRVVPELLPRVDVGDVHLDERPAQQGARVPDRVRVV